MHSIIYKTPAIIASAAIAIAVGACSSHAGGSGKTGGTGHISMSGAMTIDRDFAVGECTVSPPGRG